MNDETNENTRSDCKINCPEKGHRPKLMNRVTNSLVSFNAASHQPIQLNEMLCQLSRSNALAHYSAF